MPQLADLDDVLLAPVKWTPTWIERTLVFRGNPDGNTGTCLIETVVAKVYGPLALHPTLPGNSGIGKSAYTITHVKSLIGVARLNDEAEAVKMVQWLWAECQAAWTGEVVDVPKMTAAAVKWCKEHVR